MLTNGVHFIAYKTANRNYRSWNDRSIRELSLGMDLKEIFAINLRHARNRRHLTQEELAERSGLSSRYIGAIERADVSASVTVLGRIADALGMEPEVLIRKSKSGHSD